MTPARAAYRFFALTLALLIGYALVHCLALLAISPASSQPFAQLNALAAALLDLALVSGLIGGGIYALQPDQTTPRPLLRVALLIDWLLAILTLLAGIFDRLPSLLLSAAPALVIALVLADTLPRLKTWTAIPLVWSTGISLSAICPLLALIPLSDVRATAALKSLARGVQVHVGWTLAAIALGYFLIRRFSTVSALWAALSLRTVAVLLALAGVLLSLATLIPLGLDPGTFGAIGALLVLLIYLIAASHHYRPLANRNETDTLAAPWLALGILLLLSGAGMIGAIQIAPAIRRVTAGTWLSALPEQATLWAIMAIILGAINQIAAELRADQRRITGMISFWLVTFSVIGSVLLLAGIGLVQVYVERLLGVGISKRKRCWRRSTRSGQAHPFYCRED